MAAMAQIKNGAKKWFSDVEMAQQIIIEWWNKSHKKLFYLYYKITPQKKFIGLFKAISIK